jgi:hypothetical protein
MREMTTSLLKEDPPALQAAAFWQRWRAGRRGGSPAAPDPGIPREAPLPPEAGRHYRHFAWVIHEQRVMVLILGFSLGACALVWSMAWHLRRKPAVVVRAGPSLRAAAEGFNALPEISYDQLAFFLQGCLPLLHATGEAGHPLLPLAQGLVAPDVYREAEQRLDAAGPDVLAHRMTEGLTLTEVSDVVADAKSGRAAAYVRGYLTVTARRAEAQCFPWRARVLLAINPPGRLNPYPFYLAGCEERTGPEAPAWDAARDRPPNP